MMTRQTVKLVWRSGELIIIDPTPSLEEDLQFYHKGFEPDPKKPWLQLTVKTKVPLFRVVLEQHPRTLVTYQGLLDKVVAILKKDVYVDYTITDQRLDFPKPKIQLMKGFRARQHSTLLQLFRHERSGLLEAPTRYGKSTLIQNTLRAYPGIKTVVTAPGADLLGQMVKELQAALPEREVRGIFTGSKGKLQSDDITVVSMDSLDKVDYEGTKLVLVDEPHAVASGSRVVKMSKFKNARIYGFGATTKGRFDGADALIEGLIGPVLSRKTFTEAVDEGAICPIRVYVVRVPFDDFTPRDREAAYQALMFKNGQFNQLVKQIADHVPAQWQTLVFVDEIKQADLLKCFVPSAEVAVASRLNKEERANMFQEMVSGKIKRCIATNIYSTGVTFPDLRVVINTAGGGGSITGTQKPGRLAQNRPGKKRGYLVDFLFQCRQEPAGGGSLSSNNARFRLSAEPDDAAAVELRKREWKAVTADCFNRLRVYKNLGYEVVYVDRPDQIILD